MSADVASQRIPSTPLQGNGRRGHKMTDIGFELICSGVRSQVALWRAQLVRENQRDLEDYRGRLDEMIREYERAIPAEMSLGDYLTKYGASESTFLKSGLHATQLNPLLSALGERMDEIQKRKRETTAAAKPTMTAGLPGSTSNSSLAAEASKPKIPRKNPAQAPKATTPARRSARRALVGGSGSKAGTKPPASVGAAVRAGGAGPSTETFAPDLSRPDDIGQGRGRRRVGAEVDGHGDVEGGEDGKVRVRTTDGQVIAFDPVDDSPSALRTADLTASTRKRAQAQAVRSLQARMARWQDVDA